MMKRFFVMVRKNTMLVIAFAMISAMTLTAVANIDNGKAVTSPRLFYNGQELTDGTMIPRGGIITAEYDFVLSGKDREITVVLPDNLVPARDNGLLYLYNNNDELLGQLPLDDIIDSTITVKLTDIQLEALYTKSSRVTSDNYIISTLRGLILQVYAADNVYELNDADDMNESVSGNDINDVGDTNTVDTTDQADTPNPAEDAGQAEEPATTEASDQSETSATYEGKLIVECIPDPEIEEDYIVIGDMTITLFDMSMLTREFILDTNNLDSMEKVVEDFLVSLLYLNYEKVESEAAISFADYLRLYYEFNLTAGNIKTILENESSYYIVPVPQYLTVLQDVNSLPADLIIESSDDIFATVDVSLINGTSNLIIYFDKSILTKYSTTGLEGGFIDVVCALDKAEIGDDISVPITLSESSVLEIIISEDSVYVPEIKKTGDYDPATGTITWTIMYTHGSVLDNDGKTTRMPVYITDIFTAADQVFVDESLDVNGNRATQETVALADIESLTAGAYTCFTTNDNISQQLVYVLPSDLILGETLTITYQTALTEETLENIMNYNGSTAKKITNDAQVTDNLTRTPIGSDKAEVEVTGNDKLWIRKVGTYVEYEDRSGGYIEWTIYVNVFDDTMEYLDLYDLVADGLIFNENSVKIINKDEINYTIDTDENNNEYSFIIHFPTPLSIGTYQITYTTDVARENYEKGVAQSLGNTAWLKFGWPDGNGPIPGLDTKIPPTVEKPVNIASNSLEKKGISYDIVKHTILWEITINPHQVNISEGIFTDTLEEFKQQYVAGSFKLAEKDEKWKDLVTVVDGDKPHDKLIVNVGNIGTDAVTFTFEAIVTDYDMWSDNQVDEYFKNTAYLKAFIIPDGGEKKDGSFVEISADGTVLVNIDVLKKDSDGYDYINQTITWQVIVNADKIPMTDAKIVDTLPIGLIYDDSTNDGVKVVNSKNETISPAEYEVSWVENYDNGKATYSTLTIDLGDIANYETLFITYKTIVNPDSVDGFWNESSVEFKNSVTLQREGSFVSNPVVESVCIDGPVVSKKGSLVTSDGKVEYTIELNPNKLNMAMATGENMNNAVITDYLPDGMLLDLNSVKLYLADIDAEGNLSIPESNPTVDLTLGGNLIYDYNNDPAIGSLGQYFKIILNGTLPSGELLTKQRYILKYTAYLFTNATNSYKNEVTIDGHSDLPAEAKSNIMVYKASGGARAITFNTTARVQITKIDGAREEIKLAGVTFELYEVIGGIDYLLYTDKTDSNGVVLFGGLLSGHTYRIYETASIAGYPLVSTEPIEILVESKNLGELLTKDVTNAPQLLQGTLSFTKLLQDIGGTTLAGVSSDTLVTFKAIDKTDGSHFTATATTNENGVVTFKDLPFGIYEITEITTPNYYAAASSFYAVIDVNGNFIGFYSTYEKAKANRDPLSLYSNGDYTVINKRKTIDLTLTKMDSDRTVYINDVTFTIYKSIESSEELGLSIGDSHAAAIESGGVFNGATFLTTTTKYVSNTTTGRATFKGLEQGYYYYVFETSTPNGYEATSDSNIKDPLVYIYSPSDETNGASVPTEGTINITNTPKTGEFSFMKYGSESVKTQYEMDNVKFTATDQTSRYPGSDDISLSGYVEVAYSDIDGIVTFSELPFGVYLVEEEVPTYYSSNHMSFYAVIGSDGKFLGFYSSKVTANAILVSGVANTSSNYLGDDGSFKVINTRKEFSLTFTKYDSRNSTTSTAVLVQNTATFKLYRGGTASVTAPSIVLGNENPGETVQDNINNYIYIGEATSNEKGVVTFKHNSEDSGLKYLEQGYYYYLYETGVPTGYTDITNRFVVRILAPDLKNITTTPPYLYTYTSTRITNTPIKGNIEFIKYGTEYGEPKALQGASFNAKDMTTGSTFTQTVTSDETGVVSFTALPFGVYEITENVLDFYEVNAMKLYAVIGMDSEPKGIYDDLAVAKTVLTSGVADTSNTHYLGASESYTVTNTRKTFNLTITKRDSLRTNILLEDVQFELYQSLKVTTAPAYMDLPINDWVKVNTIKTDANGIVEISNLEQGYYYYLYETNAPDGYKGGTSSKIDTCVLSINPEETKEDYSTTIDNTPNTGSFRFTKIDQIGVLKRAVFTATEVNTGTRKPYTVTGVTSSESGLVEFADLPFGVYEITEEEMRYYENFDGFFILINENGTFGGYWDPNSGTFTGGNGDNINDTGHTVTNTRKTFSLTLNKIESNTTHAIEGVTFEIYRAGTKNVADISNQVLVDTETTLIDGMVTFNSSVLYQGFWYCIYETDTPSGYSGSRDIDRDTPIAVFFAYEDEDTIILTDGNGNPTDNTIFNDPDIGSISFKKVDEYGIMEGVTFTATDLTSYRPTISKIAVSDENGIVEFAGLPFGVYKIEETIMDYYEALPVFYVKLGDKGSVVGFYSTEEAANDEDESDSVSFITLENDDYIVRNRHEPHVLSIVKKDSRRGDVYVKGVTFEVYQSSSPGLNVKIDITPGSNEIPAGLKLVDDPKYYATNITNETGRVTFSGLSGGYWYYVYEIPTRGYAVSDKLQPKFVAAGFAEEDSIILDYEYIKLEGIPYNDFTNTVENIPNEGKFSFIKVDENGSAMAEINFTAKDMTFGSLVEREAVSGEDGKVEFTALPFGVYEIWEMVPMYYKQLVFYVKINENGSFGGFYSTPEDAESGNAITRWVTQDGGEIYNERKTSDLIITTTDSVSEAPIPGVIYELYEEGGTSPVDTQTTDAEGKIHFRKLKQGVTYVVVEITPEGYKPPANPVVYRFTPDDEEDGYVSTYPIEIDPLGSIAFNKVSDNSDALAGAEFRLTGVVEDGNKIAEMTAISNNDGIVRFENVPIGHYQIMEISAPDNYEKDEAVYYAEITRNPVFENLFEGLKDEAGALVEGNKVINKYIDPISYSGPTPSSYTKQTASSDASSESDTGLEGALPQTGQNKILAATLCICGIVLTTIGAYGFRKRRNQKNEK